jgi:hypothetical protein
MLRTYPLCLTGPAPRPEGLRSIIRRLEAEIERSPRAIRVNPVVRSRRLAEA